MPEIEPRTHPGDGNCPSRNGVLHDFLRYGIRPTGWGSERELFRVASHPLLLRNCIVELAEGRGGNTFDLQCARILASHEAEQTVHELGGRVSPPALNGALQPIYGRVLDEPKASIVAERYVSGGVSEADLLLVEPYAGSGVLHSSRRSGLEWIRIAFLAGLASIGFMLWFL